MSTYLKLDTALPAGPNYLDIKKYTLPEPIIAIGGIVSAFKFTGDMTDLFGTTAIVTGTPVKDVDGYSFGNTGYINTGLKETEEFLWVALVRISSGGIYAPVISSFLAGSLSSDALSGGVNLAKDLTSVKMNAINNSTTNQGFSAGTKNNGDWGLYALTRKQVSAGIYQYNYAFKTVNQPMVEKTSANTVGVVRNSQTTISIGWSPNGAGTIPNASTIFNFASVHNKGLTSAELATLMTNLVSDFSSQGINL